MPTPAFEQKFVGFLGVASLSVLLWDILDNTRNDFRLLFRYRLGLPTIAYFLSRVSVLGFTIVSTILSTTSSIDCTTIDAVFFTFFLIGMMSTLFLSYYRVCAVWHWNRFIIGFFGISWLAVAASSLPLVKFVRGVVATGGFCTLATSEFIMAPFITSFFNHAVVFLAITYGVCRNTIGRDLNFRDCVGLMLGKSSLMFSKALLHDSQVSYIIIMGIALTTLVWYHVCMNLEVNTQFQLALVMPYVALVNVMICRVFRSTKLGLYSKVWVQSNNSNSKTHADRIGTVSWSSSDAASESGTVTPIQIAVSKVVEYKSDYLPSLTPSRDYLDFGLV